MDELDVDIHAIARHKLRVEFKGSRMKLPTIRAAEANRQQTDQNYDSSPGRSNQTPDP